MILYRPTGLEELRLLFSEGMRAWPPRLEHQPIFYPVTTQAYAAMIASEWNTQADDFVGYVTRFEVEDSFASKYAVERVGSKAHEELWVPAQDLERFNAHMSHVEVLEMYVGRGFKGLVPKAGMWAGLDAMQQWETLTEELHTPAEVMDLMAEAVFLHWPLWCAVAARDDQSARLRALEAAWTLATPLPSCLAVNV